MDPANDGAEIVNGVAERVRRELLRNMNLADLLRPSPTKAPAKKASWRSDRIAREEEIKRFHRIGTALFRHWNVDSNGKHKPIIVTDPRL